MTARTPASRHLAATVAQYIHELSERHAQERADVVVASPPGSAGERQRRWVGRVGERRRGFRPVRRSSESSVTESRR